MIETGHFVVTIVTIGILLTLSHSCLASCYFPVELQGEFVMQSTVVAAHQVQYSHVSINAEAIPIWGQCHRRIGHHVILMDSSGVEDCIRCFLLNLRSRNVLQVHTEGLAKCYTTEEAAKATCPQQLSQADASREILLYKMKDLSGDPIPLEYCPFTGRFTYTYNVNDGSENKMECPSSVSEMHSCPSAADINLQFRQCSFDDHDITFQCLGDWQGPGNQRYLALLDTRLDGDMRPRYRCALYRQEPTTGVISMAFSSDSTCRSDLHSSVAGFETLNLSPRTPPRLPQPVQASNCRFPAWMQGRWQHMEIAGNSILYQDHVAFKTFTMRCLGNEFGPSTDRFPVFGRTQCGEEIYSCIWMKERSFNVLEFQLGLHSSSFFNSSLCSDSNFEVNQWITQGRVEKIKESPCPIPGEYTGEIPDVKGLCAKLWSHCNTSETMHYTVTDCTSQQVLEGNRRGPSRRSRQIGTGIYRISDPRTTTPLSLYLSGNHYNSPGPRYPTSYHKNLNLTNINASAAFSDIAPYDPWEFPQTHGGIKIPQAKVPTNTVRPSDGYGYRGTTRGYTDRWGYNHWGPTSTASPGFATRSVSTIAESRYYNRVQDYNNNNERSYNDGRVLWNRVSSTFPTSTPTPPINSLSQAHRLRNRLSLTGKGATSGPMLREERQYRCLGQWEEGGRVYTYTQRRDFAAYECFVGKIMSDKQIYIREAGETCQRSIDPLENGMELTRQGPCYQTPVTSSDKQVTQRLPQTPVQRYSKHPLPEPTKPWKPITGRPQLASGSSRHCVNIAFLIAILPFLI